MIGVCLKKETECFILKMGAETICGIKSNGKYIYFTHLHWRTSSKGLWSPLVGWKGTSIELIAVITLSVLTIKKHTK